MASIGATDQLNREAERRLARHRDIDRLEVLQQRRTEIPVQAIAAFDDHVAAQRRHRNALHVDQPELRRDAVELRAQCVEARLVVVDQIHLVDREHDVADAEQASDRGVATRLRQHALLRVD